jgi:Zn-dependent protease
MKSQEFAHILAAILLFTVVGSVAFVISSDWTLIPQVLLFSAIIVFASIFAKKLAAYLLDSDVEHELWKFSRYGINPGSHFKKEIPAGIIFPLVISLFSLGWLKFSAFLTYEARALKKRAAKRFGFYSFSELTEWHNALIGAAGIVACFLISIIAYFSSPGLEYLAKLSAFYALSNILPLPKLDGSQIFFGSRALYTTLAVIALIFAVYALII